MKFRLLIVFLFLSIVSFAQKGYLIHLTIDKIILGNDSVVYKTGKTFVLNTSAKTDTVEIGKPGGIPVAIVVDVRKIKASDKIKTQIGYAYFKKVSGKWELIKHFGYTDRYDLLSPRPGFATSAKKKAAREEYHCMLGQPQQFEAFFRMDVYKNVE
jgi:hypothetical protein